MGKISSSSMPLKDLPALEYIEKILGCSLKELLRFPKFFMLETINICNARCIMCGINFNKKKMIMEDALFDKIASEISQYKEHIKKVMLYLDGEPLLDKKLPDKIRKMKSLGIKRINIATNASLLDIDKAGELIKAGLDEVYITLDSLKKEIFEKIRRGLNFDVVYKNIVGFINLRNQLNPNLAIRIQMILQELNRQEEGVFVSHWTPLLNKNDQVVVQKAHNWGSTVKTLDFGDEDVINNVPCISLWGSFCIHVDGKVGLCCMDTDTKFFLGNLESQSISQIWRSETLERIREIHKQGKRYQIPICDGCTTWRESKHDKETVIGKNGIKQRKYT